MATLPVAATSKKTAVAAATPVVALCQSARTEKSSSDAYLITVNKVEAANASSQAGCTTQVQQQKDAVCVKNCNRYCDPQCLCDARQRMACRVQRHDCLVAWSSVLGVGSIVIFIVTCVGYGPSTAISTAVIFGNIVALSIQLILLGVSGALTGCWRRNAHDQRCFPGSVGRTGVQLLISFYVFAVVALGLMLYCGVLASLNTSSSGDMLRYTSQSDVFKVVQPIGCVLAAIAQLLALPTAILFQIEHKLIIRRQQLAKQKRTKRVTKAKK